MPFKERPILYSDAMVRAILAGIKTQTRRVINPQPGHLHAREWDEAVSRIDALADAMGTGIRIVAKPGACPYGEPGDRLWVREAIAPRRDVDPLYEPDKARSYCFYRADGTGLKELNWHPYPDRWTPSILMPRWACRIELEIIDIRVQRIQDISDEDIKAEGIQSFIESKGLDLFRTSHRAAWIELWDEINGRRDTRKFRWDRNPWTWAITFRRVEDAHGTP